MTSTMQSETSVDTELNTETTLDGASVDGTPQQRVLDEEEVRTTAYFLWEQDGYPEGTGEDYWWAALERIAREKSSDTQLNSNGADT